MKKNLLLRVMSALLCVCFIGAMFAGCSAKNADTNTSSEAAEDVAALEEVDPETLEQLVDGYDPEVDTDLDAERSVSNDASLAGAVVLDINGENVKFTNSKLREYTKISPNKNSGKLTSRNHKIDTITIHCMAGQLTIEACGNVFSQSKAQASSNYGIGKDGRIAMYVEEKDRSWASSNAANDNRAVTIEVASDSFDPYAVSDKAYASLIRLVTDICKRNKIEKLVWSTDKETRIKHLDGANMTVHRDYANKACPGEYLYSRMGDIASKVNKNLGVE